MTREQLIELGQRIVAGDMPDEETEKLIAEFNANVPHPSGANLFFWPENYNARRDRISDYQPIALDPGITECITGFLPTDADNR